MKKIDHFTKKYAILPPAPVDELVEVIIPSSTKVPEIKELSEKEMKDWEDFISEKKLLKDLEKSKEISNLGEEEKAGREEGTIPAVPKKKADLSSDALLKMCSKYYDLCKL